MNKNHFNLIGSMLDDYSDILENRCCNDFSFPIEWTVHEVEKFVKGYHEWNGDPEEYDEAFLCLPDFAVASYLAYLLKA